MFSSLLIDASSGADSSPCADRCEWEAEAAYQQAIQHLTDQLAAAPATFELLLHCGSLPSVSVEWQSIFASVGVGYLSIGKGSSAVSLLLTGQHAGAEAAAIEAARSMLASQDPVGTRLHRAFAVVTRQQQRPLLVTIIHDTEGKADTWALRFAAHSLATAFFGHHAGAAYAALSRTPAQGPAVPPGSFHGDRAAFVG